MMKHDLRAGNVGRRTESRYGMIAALGRLKGRVAAEWARVTYPREGRSRWVGLFLAVLIAGIVMAIATVVYVLTLPRDIVWF